MDHYTILGVAKTATPDDIKKAYRKLASKHHPDKGGDTATFQQIQSAYEVLSDPNKKTAYDNPSSQFNNSHPGGFQFHTQGFDINDLFGHIFGSGHRTNQPPKNQVFRTVVVISLDDAYAGSTNTLKLQTPNGVKMINIDIPKGIDNGGQVRYDNILDSAALIVEFRINPHLKFERRGNDLYYSQQISVLDLIIGTSFEFTTISGKTLEVSVPPKTQPHMQLKVSGNGMPIQNTNVYGDQIILLKPFIPDNIPNSVLEAIKSSMS